ncbi:isoleucine--tRNA ligase [Rarobacter incanus]|uniref:Isoleucine--tRNA ligase n=1 Tax=Rarobacter incanus TaxID=153494 RepID=A0A542SLA4_9MICO|nr:isoleucine--tRNA ligase [Rarobacter incanus]TQK75402.1 isoleucyl-tRNA synthetase [Rarobacter incanus]
MVYPRHRDDSPIPASPRFPAIEEATLKFWAKDDTFKASLEQRPAGENGSNEFVFYDGPPFANGLPHYGHLLTGYVKDIIPRFKTMRGQRVDRRFGWDTHGLPAELEAERELDIQGKPDIERIGIDTFNAACRASVLKYTREWEDYVTRQARWVDFENDYKTLDVTYMESVIWAFKTLYDKGLAYEDYRVLPYCWNDQTPLSNHELRMDDDVYQDRQDNTVTVGVRLETGELALIWTTTPWTLPSNLAIAVGPEVEYVTVEPVAGALAGEKVILAKALVSSYARELGEDARITATYPGADLVGRRYAPIFDYFADRDPAEAPGPHAFTVLAGDFVTTEDGTGIVHMAPAFGEDDMAVCRAAGIRAVVPVDDGAVFTAEVPDYQGLQVFEANKPIITDLRDGSGPLAQRPAAERAVLVRQASYVHSYPHCWRCRKPLVYKAVTSWFVAVTKFRDRMVELNQQIDWTPENVKDGQFGKWLQGARDWSISRNRYWGSPIPVWVSDDPTYPRTDVYGSLAELEKDFGRLPLNHEGKPDLHRPFIDELTRPNPDDPTGKSTMRRIPDVLDVWFDSGSMPYAQVHYPFENRDWFEHHYPGDFIVEYIGQTRGWFYLLHVLATALFDRPAFRSCVSHGIVLGSDGRKMSKSLRNYPDVSEVFDRDGADAMRWFLMSSPILRGGNLIVTEEGIREATRQVLLPLWSTYYFFTLYANATNGGSGYEAKRLEAEAVGDLGAIDRYLLARTRALVEGVQGDLDAYDVPAACERSREFMDVLTNWYVRTQRTRFWDEDPVAFDVLFTVLETVTRVIAPLAPLVTEEVWKGLTGGRSVHLTDWPDLKGALGEILVADDDLVAVMDEVRQVVSVTLSLRKAHHRRVRQPLSALAVSVANAERLQPYIELLKSELNIKDVVLVEHTAAAETEYGISRRLTVNARAAGPRLGKNVQVVIKAAKAGAWHTSAEGDVVIDTDGGPIALQEPEYKLETVVEVDATQDEPTRAAAVLSAGGFIVVDLELTPELLAEGYARDVIREVQESRKQAGLEVTDRIVLTLEVPKEHAAAVHAHKSMIAEETLATAVQVIESEAANISASVAKAAK